MNFTLVFWSVWYLVLSWNCRRNICTEVNSNKNKLLFLLYFTKYYCVKSVFNMQLFCVYGNDALAITNVEQINIRLEALACSHSHCWSEISQGVRPGGNCRLSSWMLSTNTLRAEAECWWIRSLAQHIHCQRHLSAARPRLCHPSPQNTSDNSTNINIAPLIAHYH